MPDRRTIIVCVPEKRRIRLIRSERLRLAVGYGGYPHAGDLGADQKTIGVARRVIRDDGDTTIMRTLGIIAASVVACAAILVAGVFLWLKANYPTYSHRYRLTIAIEVDGRVHTDSSVIEVIWKGGPEFGDVGPYHPSVRGQAVFIDLAGFGTAVAVLVAPSFEQGGVIRWPEGVGALWLGARAFGNGSTLPELPQLPRLRGRRDLASDNMPRLIWFSNIADPKTARRFKPDDIPTLFGPAARLAAAHVEITNDPVVIDIDKKLPWYETLKRPLGQGVIQIEYGFALAKPMFVGDAS